MLSVLIPIYNYNVLPLLAELHRQLVETEISFEILCIDDASTWINDQEHEISTFSNTHLLKLDDNLGRSRIRNLLANRATYNWLLFLDADCLVKSKDFIKNYLLEIDKGSCQVFCGGIMYQENKPIKSLLLRWKYGRNREQQDLEKRQDQPYRYFFSANFLISKNLFMSVKFDETLTEYGLEDSLFALDLKKKNIEIMQLENTVLHSGLDKADDFIEKTKSAVANGFVLYQQGRIESQHLKHLNYYLKLKKMRGVKIYRFLYFLGQPLIRLNLKSRFPFLICYDLFKLYTLSQIVKRSQVI